MNHLQTTRLSPTRNLLSNVDGELYKTTQNRSPKSLDGAARSGDETHLRHSSSSAKVVPSSAEACPLFLCPGALPKDFASSAALKISGALIDASQAPSESEDGNTDIDDHAPLSCYYESSCSESDAANRARRARARQKRRRVARLKRGRHHPFRKRLKGEHAVGVREAGSPTQSHGRVDGRSPVLGKRLGRSPNRRNTNGNSIGEVQAFMKLWAGIGNPNN